MVDAAKTIALHIPKIKQNVRITQPPLDIGRQQAGNATTYNTVLTAERFVTIEGTPFGDASKDFVNMFKNMVTKYAGDNGEAATDQNTEPVRREAMQTVLNLVHLLKKSWSVEHKKDLWKKTADMPVFPVPRTAAPAVW